MITKLYVKSAIALHEFKTDQRGVTAIEYAIIGVAISSIVLAVFNGTLRESLTAAMGTITGNISAANTPN
ncbi:Flp family type IVb pilin [Moritella sp. F3]|uniref:Flp family type IVb pilin n=1 Tax=Moritella sp. F3 TaxID=2718882 RepID=UPI0018E1D946|nr:Flp family type IVb pilin [Moritella sp. F3]GIC75576.1 fimbrial protein [Moritella sp. F1]GIC80721.1 fimbrial protein [Moritella sp. F3]